MSLISGNAFQLDHNKYDLIFCDAMHNPNEMAANMPQIIAHSNQGSVWAFHDMYPLAIECVLGFADVEYVELVDLLGIFIWMGEKLERRTSEIFVQSALAP